MALSDDRTMKPESEGKYSSDSAGDQPEIIAQFGITTTQRANGCNVLRVYRITADSPAPWIDNDWDPLLDTTNGIATTGPALWGSQGLAGNPTESPDVHPDRPLRCFLLSPPGGGDKGGGDLGACHLQTYEALYRPELVGEKPLQDLDPYAIQYGNLHRKWSLIESLRRWYRCADANERNTGLIRRVKGWSPGKCGYMSMAGWAPFEVVDNGHARVWEVTHYLHGWTWRYMDDDPQHFPKYSRLCCTRHENDNDSDIAICEISFDRQDQKTVGGDEVHYATFTLYRAYDDFLKRTQSNQHTTVEKFLFHGLVLAEKLRRRQAAGVGRS
ncbi:Uu.00g133570.m01.CDS01 [Anthostomella pinea]|uniref:Uu.00g133570.m01.CDS01 n=1 Tax=Anthostomella pinea TaxID=933095 RepID=A0AAI8VNS0_9PEZI|nr:Uu.00g133570.m01.CDS01 [Anthostomella pinea]